jgi:hypothetical protein
MQVSIAGTVNIMKTTNLVKSIEEEELLRLSSTYTAHLSDIRRSINLSPHEHDLSVKDEVLAAIENASPSSPIKINYNSSHHAHFHLPEMSKE